MHFLTFVESCFLPPKSCNKSEKTHFFALFRVYRLAFSFFEKSPLAGYVIFMLILALACFMFPALECAFYCRRKHERKKN